MEDIQDDPRFAHILSDPKFMVMPKSKKKVKIDSRFRSVFTSDKFSHKTDIDKRGRPIFDATKRNSHVMKRFYELSDEDDDDDEEDNDNDDVKSESDQEVAHKQKNDKRRKNKKLKVDDVNTQSVSETVSKPQRRISEEQNKKQTDKIKKKTPTNNKVNKLASAGKDQTISVKSSPMKDSSSDQEGSSNCTTDDDDDDIELPEFSQEFALEETDIEHKWNELHTDAVTVVESTCRLAVCNMDWDFVKAQDLFVLFKSFVPDGGQVKSVTIYPSEFGKERMAEESMLGPREIRAQTNQERVPADKEGQSGRKKNRTTNQQQAKRASKELEATQTEKLREYQLNRLRYYFAVVDCDSVVTAETIYNECDGREYLLSSVRLDLRFIPDGMTFDDPPREVFSQEQSILEYKPNQFSSTALCQAKVDVTWDETEFDRLSRRIGGMQQKELESIVEENKYADIIAPPESDSDQDGDDQPDWLKQALDSNGDEELNEEDKIAMYRKLLMEKLDDEEGDDEDELKGEEKEIVWTPGLKSSLVKRMERKERKQENTGVVNDYLEKKREKKKKKKQNKATKQTVDGKEQADTVDNKNENTGAASADKQTKKKKKKQKRDESEEKAEAKNMADLELLVMGDDDVKDDQTDKVKTSKKKSKKLKKKKKKLAEVQDEFQLDMNDPRFGALYTSQHFHIDPSSAQFKKSTHMAVLMNEQIKRRGHSGKTVNVTGSKSDQSVEPSKSLSQALVDSIKSKMRN